MNRLQLSVNSILFILFCSLTGCATPTNQTVTTDANEKSGSPTTYTHHHGWGGKNVHHIQQTAQ